MLIKTTQGIQDNIIGIQILHTPIIKSRVLKINTKIKIYIKKEVQLLISFISNSLLEKN